MSFVVKRRAEMEASLRGMAEEGAEKGTEAASASRPSGAPAAPAAAATHPRKPFPCDVCEMSFATKGKLTYHLIREHEHQRPLSPEEDTAPTDRESSTRAGRDRLGLDIAPAMERSRTDAFIVANETPNPLNLASELGRTLYGSAVRDRKSEVNPFSKSFRNHTGQSAQAADEPMGSPFSHFTELGLTAALSAMSPSLFLWSPGGALPFSLSPLLMASPTPSLQQLQAPPSAGFTNAGQPVFTLFQQAPAAAPLERPTAAATGLKAPPQTNSVTSSCNSPSESPPLPVAVVEPLPKTSVTPSSEHPLSETTAARDAKRKVEEYLDNTDSMSILSDDSHLTGYTETGMAGGEGGGGTGSRKTRPILETDDPVLADKRRRNRIAAEKCRKRRKARQDTLEVSNQALRGKYQDLSEKFKTLTASSKARIEQLTEENKAFKQENILLRTQLGALALTQQQHHHQPAPMSYPPGTFFAMGPNGQRIGLQLLQPLPNGQVPPAPFQPQ